MKRTIFAVGVVLLVVKAAVGLVGCHELTAAEQAQVAGDGIRLSMCGMRAHQCKVMTGDAGSAGYGACWDEFDACLVAHGFADAGTEGGK